MLGALGSLINVLRIGELFAGTAERPAAVILSTVMFIVLVVYLVLGSVPSSWRAARERSTPTSPEVPATGYSDRGDGDRTPHSAGGRQKRRSRPVLTHPVRESRPLQHHDHEPESEQRETEPVRIGHTRWNDAV